MPVEIHEKIGPHTLHVLISGKLTREDYDLFVPQLEKLMHAEQNLSMLVELRDFYGWDIGGLWEELKFDAQHLNDMERIAMVGDRTWQKWMTDFCKPFTTAKIEFFETPQLEKAKLWVAEGIPA